MDDIILTLDGRQALGLVLLVVFLIVPLAVSRFPQSGDPEKTPPLIILQKRMGLETLNSGLFFSAVVMWTLIFASLFLGLLSTIWFVISSEIPATRDDVWDWRFTLVGMAALTATLGAVIALPFTLIRLSLMREQTSTATQALFNDKIDAAVADLHAQRQVTKWDQEKTPSGWEDDVTRRNGAIDRFLGLASEEPEAAPRIARMLSVYVKELTREFPAKTPPESADLQKLWEWASKLRVERSDMQNAVQVLGRLRKASGADLDDGEINLIGVNLQGFDLSHLDFEKVSFEGAELQGADLRLAELQGADLSGAEFDHATTLSGALNTCAALSVVDLDKTTITSEQLNAMFGDASVTLPDGKGPDDPEWPEHWSKELLGWTEFNKQWRAFQRERSFAPDNPA